ncbi:hypothetical protein CKO28_03260 [Rhodovibrio sodomensis]|uniref:Polyamine aminopropyltransferase n=1 Tax=Rhodovibrio sodomensis TaxID=1088 RepID=A0ABS1D9G8_9PROT|nr:polyamine aminopropyltransferase [Rhodovibrio sodomensis]MBK1667063.1 hypothetical protein [Rhodovibrio sodomensis]
MTDIHASTRSTPAAGGLNPMTASLLLGLSMFATGSTGYVAECLLATVSTYILGAAIDQFSLIMAVMMLMMGLAAFLQKYVGERALIEKFVAIEVLLALLIAFAPIGTYWAFGHLPEHFGLVQFGFILAIGLLIGLEIPLIVRINETYAPNLKSNIATVIGADYIGAFLGALVWINLRTAAPLTELSYYLGAVNLLVAGLTFAYFARLMSRPRAIASALALVVTVGALFWGLQATASWTLSIEQKLYDDPITLRETTKFQHIVVTEREIPGHGKDVRIFLNGNLQLSSLDERIYHENLVHPAMAVAASRANVLILGGGDGMALREVLAYDDVRTVTLVDLDPRMIELARSHPTLSRLNEGAFDDARVQTALPTGMTPIGFRDMKLARNADPDNAPTVRVYHVDAERFLRAVPGRYDVIIADLPDPNSIELAKLYSREFYRAVARQLAPGGAMVVQSTSPYHAPAAFHTIGATIEAGGWSTLAYHDNVPSFGDWGYHLAWRGSRNAEMIKRQARQIPDDLSYLTSEKVAANFVFGRGSTVDGQVSTLMRPIVHELYQRYGWRVE